MIIGSGNIAQALNDREGTLFFASGVSDNSCTDIFQFRREEYFLRKEADSGLCCFYFSSIAVAFMDSPYFRHKLRMEQLVKDNFKYYNIIRIGNLDWDTNPGTFLNFLRNKIAKGEQVEIRDEFKYMIDKKTLLLICNSLPLTGQNEINIFSKVGKVKDLI